MYDISLFLQVLSTSQLFHHLLNIHILIVILLSKVSVREPHPRQFGGRGGTGHGARAVGRGVVTFQVVGDPVMMSSYNGKSYFHSCIFKSNKLG